MVLTEGPISCFTLPADHQHQHQHVTPEEMLFANPLEKSNCGAFGDVEVPDACSQAAKGPDRGLEAGRFCAPVFNSY